MAKNKQLKKQARADAHERNAEWRKMTYAQQLSFVTREHPGGAKKQVARITERIAKFGASAVPADVERGHLQDAPKKTKKNSDTSDGGFTIHDALEEVSSGEAVL